MANMVETKDKLVVAESLKAVHDFGKSVYATKKEMVSVSDNVDLLGTRLDNFISSDAGDTDVEKEVLDAKVGVDGTVYGSLGTAIREQFNLKLDKDCKGEITEDMLAIYSSETINILGKVTENKLVNTSNLTTGKALAYKNGSGYAVTDMIPVTEGDYLIDVAISNTTVAYALDENGNYVKKCSVSNNISLYNKNADKYFTVNKITVDSGIAYIVISFGANVRATYLMNLNIFPYVDSLNNVDGKMHVKYDSNFVNNIVKSINKESIPSSKLEGIGYDTLSFMNIEEINILRPEMIKDNYFFYQTPSTLYRMSGAQYTTPIPVEEGVSYGCAMKLLNSYVVFLDENFVKVHHFEKNTDMNPFTVPTGYNIKYIVLSSQTGFGNNPTIIKSDDAVLNLNYYKGVSLTNKDGIFENYIKKVIASNSENTLLGKKWLCCGDSITYFGGNYESIIANKNSMTLDVLARAGWTITDLLNGLNNKTNGVSSFTDYDHDIVTIFIGTNNREDTIGTIDDEPSADSTATFYAKFKYLLMRFFELYPHQRIGVITNYNMGKTSDKAVRDAIIAVCESYGMKTKDTFKSFNTLWYLSSDHELYRSVLGDGLHPTKHGYEILARDIEPWMRTL